MVTGVGAQLDPLLHALSGMRVAVVDQRGTGSNALHCRALQHAHLSDLTVPPGGAVGRCGAGLGPRRGLYDTTATVADLDAIRAALGLRRWALLGVSYGTYVAERYARAHADRVSALVLDSVVPQQRRPVLRRTCAAAQTGPARSCARGARAAANRPPPRADLHRLVRRTNRTPLRGHGVTIDGPALFDLITSAGQLRPVRVRGVPHGRQAALAGRRRAAAGDGPLGARLQRHARPTCPRRACTPRRCVRT